MSKPYDADLVGCDTETGGLNGYFTLESGERVHGALYRPLIELAFVFPRVESDGQLNIDAGETLVVGIALNDERMSRMDPWALEQHTKSGLLERLKTGEGFDYVATSNEEAEMFIIERLELLGVRPFEREARAGAMLFGNNIGFDFSFIDAQMPKLAAFFHYRKLDVSAVNVLSRTVWKDIKLPQPQKEFHHTALADITESTDELNGYSAYLQAVMDFTENNAKVYGIHQSTKSFVDDNNGMNTENWDDELAKIDKGKTDA